MINTVNSGINAPHLGVDYWRSIFAANYTPLADTGLRRSPASTPRCASPSRRSAASTR